MKPCILLTQKIQYDGMPGPHALDLINAGQDVVDLLTMFALAHVFYFQQRCDARNGQHIP